MELTRRTANATKIFLPISLASILLLSTITPYLSPTIANAQTNGTAATIPAWIKNNAKWWSQGQIGDDDFTKGIQYLIDNGIMVIPTTSTGNATSAGNATSQSIPSWIKNNAGWWASGQISDDEFVKGMQYLVSNGIISTSSTGSVTPPQVTLKEHNSTYYHLVEMLPSETTGDFVVTIKPNQKYTPTVNETNGTDGLQIYGVQYTHTKTDTTFSYTISYFVPYSALPADVVSSLQTKQTGTSEYASRIPTILVDVLHSIPSHLIDVGTGSEESGVWVTIKALFPDVVSKILEKWFETADFSDGIDMLKAIGVTKNVVEAMNLSVEYKNYQKQLDDAEDCVKQQPNARPASNFWRNTPTSADQLSAIDNVRSDIKISTAITYGGLLSGTGIGEVPIVGKLAELGVGYVSKVNKELNDEELKMLLDHISPCGPPINLQAAGGDKRVDLTWQPPSKLPPNPIIGYNIFKGSAPSGEGTNPIATVMSSSPLAYTDTGVTNGETYYYTVSAFNKAGESAASVEAEQQMSSNLVFEDNQGEIIIPTFEQSTEEEQSVPSNEVSATPNGNTPLEYSKWDGTYSGHFSELGGSLTPISVSESGTFTIKYPECPPTCGMGSGTGTDTESGSWTEDSGVPGAGSCYYSVTGQQTADLVTLGYGPSYDSPNTADISFGLKSPSDNNLFNGFRHTFTGESAPGIGCDTTSFTSGMTVFVTEVTGTGTGLDFNPTKSSQTISEPVYEYGTHIGTITFTLSGSNPVYIVGPQQR